MEKSNKSTARCEESGRFRWVQIQSFTTTILISRAFRGKKQKRKDKIPWKRENVPLVNVKKKTISPIRMASLKLGPQTGVDA